MKGEARQGCAEVGAGDRDDDECEYEDVSGERVKKKRKWKMNREEGVGSCPLRFTFSPLRPVVDPGFHSS